MATTPGRSDARYSNPDFIGGVPKLTTGFHDWHHCDLGGRLESLPGTFSLPQWGPAALTSSAGCSTCGGGARFSGNPKEAGLGFVLAPPHDALGDVGQLPPNPRDHANVLAETGEVVYSEVDFVIPGKGFDFVWKRTYRSALEFEGWQGYGWTSSGELYLMESANGDVTSLLGDGRVEDVYSKDSSGSYTSPVGAWNQLVKGTRSGGSAYFTLTERSGVFWEFDLAIAGQKTVYVCTKIGDPFGNFFTLGYDTPTQGDPLAPTRLKEITDTEGHVATFTYTTAKDLIASVTVSGTSIDAAYGDITIDYSYDTSTGELTHVEKHKTRQVLNGAVVRPYTDYSYVSTANYAHNLNTVSYSGSPASLDFDYLNRADDRCSQVVDADGETHTYLYNQTDGSDTWTQYTDPSGQRRDFLYTDYANGDRTTKEVREYLEDKDGADLATPASLQIVRGCACGQITELIYPDGSKEKWEYDAVHGSVTKYTRVSSDSSDLDLVKVFTYGGFPNTRLLTSSAWLSENANPSAQITWTWDAAGRLDKVTLPTASTGVPTSQSIVYDYSLATDGTLTSLTDPEGNQTTYSYSGNDLTVVQGAGTSESSQTSTEINELGGVTGRVGILSGDVWSYIVTPDGRTLSANGPANQHWRNEYDLRGRVVKRFQRLSGATETETDITLTNGSVASTTTADVGGLSATSTFTIEEAEANRYAESLDPDNYGQRSQWGYGSYGLTWKTFAVDDHGTSKVTLQTGLLERDTMGRVTAREGEGGGGRVETVYDGFGRVSQTKTFLPNNKVRVVERTLEPWGAVKTTETTVGTTVLAKSESHYDQARRLWWSERINPDTNASRGTFLERDANGRVVKRTDARGGEQTTVYRADGRTKSTQDAAGNQTLFAYDDVARTQTRTQRDWNTDTSSFTDYTTVTNLDAAGRTLSVEDKGDGGATSRTTSFSYDDAGRRLSRTSPMGTTDTFIYDPLGRLTTEHVTIDASTTATTITTWSLGGRKDSVTDANGYVSSWTYDMQGKELTVTYPVDASTTSVYTKSYDTKGRLETETDPMGVVKTYVYDDGDRVDHIDIAKNSSGLGGPDRIQYVYDDLDRITDARTQLVDGQTVTDETVVLRSYNGFGEMESETQDGGFVLGMSYAAADGDLDTLTYPSGGPIQAVDFVHDMAGRVTEVKRTLGTLVEGVTTPTQETEATFGFAGYREVRRTQAAQTLLRTQSYTSFREPLTLRYENSSSQALLTGFTQLWDADGRPVVRDRLHGAAGGYAWGEVYQYDLNGRMIGMWRNVRNPQNFSSTLPDSSSTYDDKVDWSIGRVYERESVVTTPKSGSGVTNVAYTSNQGYQYTQIGTGTPALSWDQDGQMTSDGTDDYQWSARGKMIAFVPNAGSTLSYKYDAFGRRVSTTENGATTHFLYHGWHMIGVHDGTNWLWQEIPLDSGEQMLLHVSKDDADIDGDSNTTEYRSYAVHEDWQDTVWALSDASGVVKERYIQDDPYGETHTLDASGTDIGLFASNLHHVKRMHGGVTEEASGMYDFRNRWLRSVQGGWLSRDPLGIFLTVNSYQAFLGSALVLVDFMGLTEHYPCPSNRSCDPDEVESARKKCAEGNLTKACAEACGLLAAVDLACDESAQILEEALSEALAGKPKRYLLDSLDTGTAKSQVRPEVQALINSGGKYEPRYRAYIAQSGELCAAAKGVKNACPDIYGPPYRPRRPGIYRYVSPGLIYQDPGFSPGPFRRIPPWRHKGIPFPSSPPEWIGIGNQTAGR